MSTNRKVVFTNEEIYHIFNRGIEKRACFLKRREYSRALETLQYYQYMNIPKKFSEYLNLSKDAKKFYLNKVYSHLTKQLDILAYCFMPNHFHFLVKQKAEQGITRFMANFTNSYTKYFNTKHQIVGQLFQSFFKAVYVEDYEQLIHISRYIHLNPVASYQVSYSRELEAIKHLLFD